MKWTLNLSIRHKTLLIKLEANWYGLPYLLFLTSVKENTRLRYILS